ncbi:MAG: MgtC/SapB family protein [Candidatus Aenigmatarchaeota archaeon]
MNVISLNLLIKFVISLAMGAVIGIERERRAKGTVFAGFRTFMLICSLGLITAFLHANFSQFFSFLIVLIIGSLCSLNFYRKIAKNKEAGITTEVALLLTFFIGFIFYFEEEPYIFSLGLTFILTWILFLKEKMHEFAHKIKVEEVRDFLIFGLIFFVIYPILPNQPIDPLGTLNLKFVWFGLVLILGLSFFVYIIIKLLKYKGLILDAILGGLINSIYMSNFFSSKLSEGKVAKYAILLSLSSLLNRVFILSTIINFNNFSKLLFLPIVSFMGYIVGVKKLRELRIKREDISLKSPLDLKFAFIYILIFISIFYVANLMYIKLGKDYIYLLLPIGILDTSSLTVTVSSLLSKSEVSRFLTFLIILNILGNFIVIYKNNKKIAKEVVNILVFLSLSILLFYLLFNFW